MKRLFFILLISVLFLLLSTFILAQTDDFELNWFTLSNGGGKSIGGEYSLFSVIGQPIVGKMNREEYELQGGLPAIQNIEPLYNIYLPIILKH